MMPSLKLPRRCLNLGCGRKATPSTAEEHWVNLDIAGFPGVDVVRDLRRGLPFADASFNYCYADNVLEHFVMDPDGIFVLNEIDRVLKVGGRATIIVPHADSQGAKQDPTHKALIVPRSWFYWNQEMSCYGGTAVGITANLVATKEPEVYGDLERWTEVFIRFELMKREIDPKRKVTP